MPYPDPKVRGLLHNIYRRAWLMREHWTDHPGNLNFLITKLLIYYTRSRAEKQGGVDYRLLNEVVGAVESAKAEFRRRMVDPYEDLKIKQNGDVYAEE